MTDHCSALLQILFLNKDDLFVKKVQSSDIKNFFPVRDLPRDHFYNDVGSEASLRRTLTARQTMRRQAEITSNADLAD